MDSRKLLQYLERLDEELNTETVQTAPVPELIASKLIRYDEIDQRDIQFLCAHRRVDFGAIEEAVGRLPAPFNHDPIVLDNLKNLEADLRMWKEKPL